MLYLNSGHSPRTAAETPDHRPGGPAESAVWLDLLSPTDAERALVERLTRLRVPAQSEVAEIEASSRLSTDGEAFYLSTPMTFRNREGTTAIGPLGFVLSPNRLITLRFAEMPVFDHFAERFAGSGEPTSAAAFMSLLEAIVDRLADVLETVGSDLEQLSRTIFHADANTRGEKNAAKIDQRLRGTLRAVGQLGERLANLRDSLLGLQRLSVYVHDSGQTWLEKEQLRRCSTLRKDVASLMEYDSQINNKVQFLLDATLGFINIEQNNGIKVLTVVSVVGVPPTLVASIYGMNFKNMPELDWAFGYQYGLTLIVLSALLPLIWFKKRGWI